MSTIPIKPSEIDALRIKTIHWQKNWKIPKTSWSICGFSRSAYRTGFYIPELNIMLDAGPQNFNTPSHILITHTHIDHIACLPLTMIGGGDHIFQIYAPNLAKSYVEKYIQSMFNVNAVEDVTGESWYKNSYIYNGLTSGDKFRICANKTNLSVQVYHCDHAIPTVCYGISECKQKLKSEYVGLNSKEIVKLRSEGIQITNEVVEKKLSYVCDTSIEVLKQTEILEYPVIFIECTFFMNDEIDNAKTTKHIHWDDLKPYVTANPNIIFVLFHFSQRYRDIEISEFFQKEVDGGLKNLQWW